MVGPSPRVRGKPIAMIRKASGCGSIPARAGETERRDRSLISLEVHPRACGETRRAEGPRSRLRSIPARAGETVP